MPLCVYAYDLTVKIDSRVQGYRAMYQPERDWSIWVSALTMSALKAGSGSEQRFALGGIQNFGNLVDLLDIQFIELVLIGPVSGPGSQIAELPVALVIEGLDSGFLIRRQRHTRLLQDQLHSVIAAAPF